MSTKVRNDLFNSAKGFERGRPVWIFALWQIFKWAIFRTILPWPSGLKIFILRAFGAKIGRGVIVKPQVNIHLPWKLEIGDHAWIGEEVFILNFEKISIGSHTCISQRAFLCGGNHDFRDPAMSYRNASIVIQNGAWVGAQVFIAPGVIVGQDAVLSACSVLLKSADPERIYAGNPAVAKGCRWGNRSLEPSSLARCPSSPQ